MAELCIHQNFGSINFVSVNFVSINFVFINYEERTSGVVRKLAVKKTLTTILLMVK
jgi:hypothetical protein